MASARIIMKQAHRLKLEPAGELALPDRSYQLLDDVLSAKLVADGLAVLEQDVIDGKLDPETLEPVVALPAVIEVSWSDTQDETESVAIPDEE